MLNQCILVGRLVSDPVLVTEPDGTVKSEVTLAIQRGYKNDTTGEYDTDHIKITLWSGIAENTVQYCKANSTVGVKARLSNEGDIIEVIAEKITFINTEGDGYDS